MPTLTIYIQYCIGNLIQKIDEGKKNQSNQLGREDVKLSLYANDMTIYRKL